MTRDSAALGALILLCGCTLAPKLPPAGDQFDGTYVGDTRLVRGSGFVCGIADLPKSIVVKNGRFEYPFQVDPPTVAPLEVQVYQNGTFDHWEKYLTPEAPRYNPVEGFVSVKGTIRNGTLAATESDMRCSRHSVLTRVGMP